VFVLSYAKWQLVDEPRLRALNARVPALSHTLRRRSAPDMREHPHVKSLMLARLTRDPRSRS
jgi:hypothetical protein